jgi:hypothetical protein
VRLVGCEPGSDEPGGRRHYVQSGVSEAVLAPECLTGLGLSQASVPAAEEAAGAGLGRCGRLRVSACDG